MATQRLHAARVDRPKLASADGITKKQSRRAWIGFRLCIATMHLNGGLVNIFPW